MADGQVLIVKPAVDEFRVYRDDEEARGDLGGREDCERLITEGWHCGAGEAWRAWPEGKGGHWSAAAADAARSVERRRGWSGDLAHDPVVRRIMAYVVFLFSLGGLAFWAPLTAHSGIVAGTARGHGICIAMLLAGVGGMGLAVFVYTGRAWAVRAVLLLAFLQSLTVVMSGPWGALMPGLVWLPFIEFEALLVCQMFRC